MRRHLQMENWQERAAGFARQHHLQRTPEIYALDLLSELGEVAKEILTMTDYGRRPAPTQPSPEMVLELGDALYSLCLLATAVDVDLEEALAQTLAKYENRWQAHGHPGSQ